MKHSFFKTVIISLILIAILFIIRSNLITSKHVKLNLLEPELGQDIPESSPMKPDTFLQIGKDAEKGERYEDALIFYKMGVQYFPKNEELLLSLARVQKQLGNQLDAKKSIEEALLIDQQSPQLHADFSAYYFSNDQFPEALGEIEKAVHLDPNNVEYLSKLAHLQMLNRKYISAEQTFERLLEIAPDRYDYPSFLPKIKSWAKENPPRDHHLILLDALKKSLESSNESEAQDIEIEYIPLFGYTKKFQHLLAEYIYIDMLKKNPKDCETWFRLATFYDQFQRYQDALDAIRKATLCQPDNLDFLKLYVVVLDEFNFDEEKIEVYKKILALNPNDEETRINLVLLQATAKLMISIEQIKSNPLLLRATMAIYEGDLVQGYTALREYAKTQSEDPLYQALLSYLADRLDRNFLYCTEDSAILFEMTEALLTLGVSVRDTSYALQNTAYLISNCLTYRDPCCIPYWNLFAASLRHLEDPPFVDLEAARRAYIRVLHINPCDQEAFRNLARVTGLLNWTDRASSLYRTYLSIYEPDPDTLIEYADILEDQGDIGKALRYLALYQCLYGCDDLYSRKRVHVANTGDLSTCVLPTAIASVEADNCDFDLWINYTNAMANLRRLDPALYGLRTVDILEPGRGETKDAHWGVIPPWMSRVTLEGKVYRETTSLKQFTEGLRIAKTKRRGLQYEIGVVTFQAFADQQFNDILGLGQLSGINGEEWASEGMGYLGILWQQNPFLIVDTRLGVARENVGDIVDWTPTYEFILDYKPCDTFHVDFLSSYGFLLYSPRSLSLKIQQWRNELITDWQPCWGKQLLLTFETNVYTDGNKQLEIICYPRHTVLYLRHWKLDVGFAGDWLTSRHIVQHGYYSPGLYQSYGVELLLDYIFDYRNVFKVNGTAGTWKDNFTNRFGFLGNVKCEGIFNFSPCWLLTFGVDYYYLEGSQGHYYYIEAEGAITYRF